MKTVSKILIVLHMIVCAIASALGFIVAIVTATRGQFFTVVIALLLGWAFLYAASSFKAEYKQLLSKELAEELGKCGIKDMVKNSTSKKVGIFD